MLRPLFGDFETRSKAKLKDVGGRVYAEHPTTQVLCCSFELPNRKRFTWTPWPEAETFVEYQNQADEMADELRPWIDRGHAVAFHNAVDFDRHIWRLLKWPEPKKWIDTAELARVGGYPKADLDWLLTNLLHRRKDLEGSKLTKKLSVPSRAKARFGLLPELTAEILDRVCAYCEDDLGGLVEIYDKHLHKWLDMDLPGYEDVQRAMNDRGICFDKKLARVLLVCDELLGEAAVKKAKTTAAVVKSPVQFREALEALGVDAPNAKKETVDALLLQDPPISKAAKLICLARQASSSIAAGKLRAALLRISQDGRLRDSLRYYGGHTGREAGRGVQLQNLPKGPALELDETIDAILGGDMVMLCSASGKPGDPEYQPEVWKKLDASGVCSLLRACLQASPGHLFVVSDWSQVEGRGLAWAADERDALKLYRRLDAGDKSADPYKVMAGRVYGISSAEVSKVQRQVGKVAILGCGYQMGKDRFHDHAVKNGVDWKKIHPLKAGDVVKAWRNSHQQIVGFWYEMQDAAMAVTLDRQREVEVGPFTWINYRGLIINRLPSGRVIVYRGMAVSQGKDDYGRKRLSLSYVGRKGKEHTYGGKLTENAIQAMCGCLMREGVIKAERAGLRPLITIHDELVCESPTRRAPADLKLLEQIMCDVPRWAKGMPIAAEGFVAERYKKG